MLIRDVLRAYEVERLPVVVSPYRLRRCVSLLDRMIGADEITDQVAMRATVARYLQLRLAAGVVEATVRRELITLKAAVRAAWKSGQLASLYYVQVPGGAPARQRWLTQQEARRLLARAQGDVRTFLLLGLCTGARIGAILELTWDRVDLRGGQIDFRSPGSARRKHRAVAPIAQVLAHELRAIRPARPRGRRVITLAACTIRRRIHALAAACRIKPVTPHVLRHTAATWLLSGGRTDLVTASRLLGHKSTAITEQVYAHIAPRHLQEAADTLGVALIPPVAGER